MPATAVITNLAQYVGEDKQFLDTIYQSDGVTPQNILGWQASFIVHKYGDPSVVFITKTTATGIQLITQAGGTFPTQLLIPVDNADTLSMFPDQYEWRATRTDIGNDILLSKGLFTLLR